MAELKEKLETPTSEIEQVRNTLINEPGNLPETIERVKKATIIKIKDDVYSYSIDWKNIKTFFKKNWEAYLVTDIERKTPFFENVCWIAWVIEKNNNWTYEMYKQEIWDKGTPILRKIDIYSVEYFKIWKEIDFYNTYAIQEAWKIWNDKINLVRKNIDRLLKFWFDVGTLRIKDLQAFMKEWDKEKEPYKTALKKLEQLLPQQCLDIRFDKIWDPITSDPKNNSWELETYLKDWLITKDTYDKCIENLKRKQKDKQEIHSFTRQGVSEVIWIA